MVVLLPTKSTVVGQGAQRKLGALFVYLVVLASLVVLLLALYIAMRTPLKVFATVAVFGIFYACAFFIMKGAQDFEKRGEIALFTSKSEAIAIANAESYEASAHVATAQNSVWKQ